MSLRVLTPLLMACLAGLAHAQEGAADQVERDRISRERAAVHAAHEQAVAQCFQQFVVSDCRARADRVQRDALADLRRQEATLNDAERRRAGAAQMQRLEARQSAAREAEAANRRERALADQADREQRASSKMQAREQAATSAQGRVADQVSREQSQAAADREREARAARVGDERRRYEDRQADAQARREKRLKTPAPGAKPPAQPLPVPP
jgi:hypothetical protein